MSEILHMDGYAFYVWGSMACFLLVLIVDAISLKTKKTHIFRKIHSMLKRKKL
ncbi:MAG: heme exporter protein CcmD [Proteobacteria bacterium]|nr:heme exporter protein CcmD [Pseudomonadota bacterium]